MIYIFCIFFPPSNFTFVLLVGNVLTLTLSLFLESRGFSPSYALQCNLLNFGARKMHVNFSNKLVIILIFGALLFKKLMQNVFNFL